MKQSLIFSLFVLLAIAPAWAQAPSSISVQGLAANDGAPLADGTYTIELRLYSQATGGQPVDEQIGSAEVQDGRFAVLLDGEGLAFDQLTHAISFDRPHRTVMRAAFCQPGLAAQDV